MSIMTWIKIGVFALTLAVSAFFVWLDFYAHTGFLPALLVYLAGVMVLFGYELFLRTRDEIGRKTKKLASLTTSLSDIQRAQMHDLHCADQIAAQLMKLAGSVEVAQARDAQMAGVLAGAVEAAQARDAQMAGVLAGAVEAAQARDAQMASMLGALQEQQKEVLQRVEMVAVMGAALDNVQHAQAHNLNCTDRMAELLIKLVGHNEEFAAKEADMATALVTLQKQQQEMLQKTETHAGASVSRAADMKVLFVELQKQNQEVLQKTEAYAGTSASRAAEMTALLMELQKQQQAVLQKTMGHAGVSFTKTEALAALMRELMQQQQEVIKRIEKVSAMGPSLDNMQYAQAHNLHRTDRMVDLLRKLVEHVEGSSAKEAESLAASLKSLADRIELSSQKEMETIAQLQRFIEMSVKRDVLAKDKLAEIVRDCN